jgi:hypothetical protein
MEPNEIKVETDHYDCEESHLGKVALNFTKKLRGCDAMTSHKMYRSCDKP